MFYVVSVRFIYSNVWFQCKTCECLVSFKFLTICLAWVVFSDHFITKRCYRQTKIFAGLLICVLATSLLVFQGQCIIFFLHNFSSLQSSITVHDKKLLKMILLCFKFTRTLVFTICPTVMFNFGDNSIRFLEKNTDVHQQIQTLIVKTDHLALKLGSKK